MAWCGPPKGHVGLGILQLLFLGAVAASDVDARGADGPDSYLRYAHPTIREPFVDLINLAVPTELEDQPLTALGYVDVTKGPFRADPTGTKDSTQAVQAAVVFARDHQMACFFPAGTYLLSDTLSCTQQLYKRTNGRVFGGNRFPNVLVGSRAAGQIANPSYLLSRSSMPSEGELSAGLRCRISQRSLPR